MKMEPDFRKHSFQCPCFGIRKECNNFEKFIHLKDTGLVIYQHHSFQNSNKEDELMKNTKKGDDVFILKNIKDVEVTSANFILELEKQNISCPRCRNIVERIKVLLQKNPAINKNAVIGVCNHCLKEGSFQNSCYKCKNVVKQFVAEYEQNKQMKIWISKVQNVLQNLKSKGEKSVILKSNNSQPDIQSKSSQMIKTTKKSIAKSSEIEASPQFIITTGSLKSSKIVTPTQYFQQKPATFIAEDFLKSKKKSFSGLHDSIFLSNQNIDDKNSVIEKNQIEIYKELNKHFEPKSLCDLEKTKTTFRQLCSQDYTPQKAYRENIVNPDLSIKSFQKLEGHVEIVTDLEFSDSKCHKFSNHKIHFIKNPSGQESERQIPLDTFDDVSMFCTEQKPHLELPELSYIYSKRVSLGKDRKAVRKEKKYCQSLLETRRHHSEEALNIAEAKVTRDVMDKDFSFCFPNVKTFKKEPKYVQSSAELILDTQNMLNARMKEEMQRNEEKYKQQLREQERKKIVQEEKVKLLKERTKQKKAEEQEEKSRKEEEIKQKSEVKPEKTDETLKNVKQGMVKSLDKIKQRGKNIQPLKVAKEIRSIKKDKEKIDKEEPFRLQKQDNLRENKGKEKIINDRKEQLQNEIPKIQKHNDSSKKESTEALGKDEETQKRKKEGKDKKIKLIEQQKKIDDNQSQKQEKVKYNDEVIKRRSKDIGNATELTKKALLELAKEKRNALKIKRDQDETDRLGRKTAIKKETDELKLTIKKEVKSETVKEKSRHQKNTDFPTTKELNINQIKVWKPLMDNLTLQLVELKQSEAKNERHKTTRLSELSSTPLCIKEHQKHKNTKLPTCLMCMNSDLELGVESIVMKKDRTGELADIIIGPKIFKYKPPLSERKQKGLVVPILFQTVINENISLMKDTNISKNETEKSSLPVVQSPKYEYINEQEPPKGVIRYALSDRTYIDKGWTMLPMEKVVRKMNVYRMRPAHPEFDWFLNNKTKKLMLYNTGEKLAEFDDNGLGRWFYRNGRIALDYYNTEEMNAQQRIVVYSSGESDKRGRTHPPTILATFDYLGNGIVFDNGGKIRLKYNQTEGVLLDRSIGPVSHWKWHTLNDPPVLQKVMIDTQMAHKDPEILKMSSHGEDINHPDNEEMLAIEFDNFIREKSKKLSQTFKPFQIKMKALKINEYFSLKILDQATVYLIFRDGTVNLKLNIGMILDHKEIIDTDTAEVGEVSNNLERFPAQTNSLAGLQRSIAYAQRFERLRTDRERRLYPTESCFSVDRVAAPASQPLRLPFQTVSFDSTTTPGSFGNTQYCKYTRKLSSTDVYYNTRLI